MVNMAYLVIFEHQPHPPHTLYYNRNSSRALVENYKKNHICTILQNSQGLIHVIEYKV